MAYVVHLEVEPACVADGVTVLVSSPQRRHVRHAVGTRRARSTRRRLQTAAHSQRATNSKI